MTTPPTAPTTHGPTVRDLTDERQQAVRQLQYPDYPVAPGTLQKNKALRNIAAYLDELIVARLTRIGTHGTEPNR